MRILVIHNYYQDHGGEDVVFQQEVNALKSDFQVETLTFQNKKSWKGAFQYLLYPWNIFAYIKTKKKIKNFKPDVVHIHNTHYASGPMVIRAVKSCNKPVIMTLHNFRLLCPSATLFYNGKIFTDSINVTFPWKAVRLKVLDNSFPKTFATAFTYYLHQRLGTWKSVDMYLPLAHFSKSLFLNSKRKLKEEQFSVKPNFVEIAVEKRTPTEHYLFVGRLSLEKGIKELVNAFIKTDKNLVIIGDGPLYKEIEAIASNYKNITLKGQQSKEKIISELAKAKAILVPSVCFEGGVSLAIIEALACKTPVLASNIGAIADCIKPKETGWLFDPYDSQSIIDCLHSFESTINTESIVEKGLLEYNQLFTKDKVYQQLVNIYQNQSATTRF